MKNGLAVKIFKKYCVQRRYLINSVALYTNLRQTVNLISKVCYLNEQLEPFLVQTVNKNNKHRKPRSKCMGLAAFLPFSSTDLIQSQGEHGFASEPSRSRRARSIAHGARPWTAARPRVTFADRSRSTAGIYRPWIHSGSACVCATLESSSIDSTASSPC